MNYREPKENFSDDFSIDEIPQFVSIGFDDNGVSGYRDNQSAMKWAVDLFNGKNNPRGCCNALAYDDENCTATYFCSSKYIDKFHYNDPEDVKKSWLEAFKKRMRLEIIVLPTNKAESLMSLNGMKKLMHVIPC